MNHKWLSSCFGLGYLPKGSGTLASAVTLLFWYVLPGTVFMGLILASIPLGIWSASQMEPIWGKDNPRVVIDEFAGMGISLFGLSHTPIFGLLAFGLFRFFDIVKPLGIRKLEALPKGWGVMADDLLAGVYSLIVLRVICYFF